MTLLDWIELSDEEATAEEEFPPQNVKDEFPPTKVKEEFPPTKVKEEFPPTIVKEEQGAHVHCHAAQLEVEPVDLTTEEDDVEEDRNAHGKRDAAQWAKTSHSQQFVAPHGQGEAAWTVVQRQEFLAAAKGVEEFLVTGDVAQETMQSGNQDFTAAVDCAEEATHSENAAEAGPSSFTEQGVVAGDCDEEAMQPGKQDFAAAVDCAEETMQYENAAEAGPSSFTEQGVVAGDCGEEAMQPGKQDFAAAVDCAEEAMQSENAAEAGTSSFTEQGVVAGDCNAEAMQPGNQNFAAAIDCAEEAMQSENAAKTGPSSFTEQGVVAGYCSEEAMQYGNQDFVAAVDCAEEAMQSENAAVAGPLSFTGQGFAAGVCGEEAMQSGKQDFIAAVDCSEEAMQSENAVEAAPSSFTDGVAAGDFAEEAMRYNHEDKAAECSPMTGQAGASSLSLTEQDATTSSLRTVQQSHKRDALLGSPPISTAAPFPRQFWKAGEYKVAARASINSGQNCLRINPKFLHSNATSHKWVFGAIAELLDNAVDEVQNGATYVKIDKIKHSPVGEYSLMIQDDGGGMSPEYIRHCLSFGFSNKCTNSSIGQYGNGFKTSTMRLGADAIIFSCNKANRLTRSVGLLSYTFLKGTGCDDILVPVVDYEFDPSSCNFKRIMDRGEQHFFSNLSTLLRWSPFSTEDDLLNQFEDMGCHGTKIVVFNLWLNDANEMELDFTTDGEDIMMSGAPKIPEERAKVKRLNHMHIANRFRYSLRVYASILYLRLPEHFEVILCGRTVEPHHIVKDLIYRECIKYRPQVGVSVQVDVVTSIGFLKGAPHLDIYGFNIYHRNRLILPFWAAGSERGRGRGIAGVLEANFIRPTHDKQDFEKTELFQRLETRLKDMTMEYWKHHAHLIGYRQITKSPPAYYASIAATHDNTPVAQAAATIYVRNSRAKASGVLDSHFNGGNSLNPLHVGALRDQMDYGICSLARRNMRTSLYMPSTPQQTEPCKRRNSGSMIETRAQKRHNTNGNADHLGSVNVVEFGDERSRVLICQKMVLKAECSELEAAAQNLQSKADRLRGELREWQRRQRSLTDELEFYDGLSAIRSRIPRASTSSMGVGWI
ncbi:protein MICRORCHIDIA 6-like isoform X2 [Hordeum vulgare subsp. vulgare]|uniref:Morc S5 domain-containing protein n=1 Tax=Hordeum vulgare subsp. vulgare TaxID=112509 RepID=A0A8I7BE46_HORVV|nr:protein MICRORCHIDIA 6-like isoform X2 [Hordeum vulgare subsp. vulgare]